MRRHEFQWKMETIETCSKPIARLQKWYWLWFCLLWGNVQCNNAQQWIGMNELSIIRKKCRKILNLLLKICALKFFRHFRYINIIQAKLLISIKYLFSQRGFLTHITKFFKIAFLHSFFCMKMYYMFMIKVDDIKCILSSFIREKVLQFFLTIKRKEPFNKRGCMPLKKKNLSFLK